MKLKNLVKAGMISLPLILGNPFNNQAKAQENYTSKYNTIAHKMIDIEQSYKGYVTRPKKTTLDKLIDESKDYIPQKDKYTLEEGKKICKDIYEHIPKKRKIDYNLKDICYRNSLAFLAIARANNLPVYLVASPAHLFPRWDPDGKHNPLNPNDPVNKGDFNFETTKNFKRIRGDTIIGSGEYSIKDLNQETIKNSYYLRNLNDSQLLSIAHLKGSEILRMDEEYEKALEATEKALKLFPSCPETLISKARCYGGLKEYDKAIEIYDNILKKFPKDTTTKTIGEGFIIGSYWGKIKYLKESGREKQAKEVYKKSRKHVPDIDYFCIFIF